MYSPDPSEVNLAWNCYALVYEKVISSKDPKNCFITNPFIQYILAEGLLWQLCVGFLKAEQAGLTFLVPSRFHGGNENQQ